MRYQPGDILLAKYRLEALVGQGTYTEVYRATHLDLNAPRVVKILPREAPGLGNTEYQQFLQQFQSEAQLGANLDHPHIARVYDFDRVDGTLLLAMEYVPGGSLADHLADLQEKKQRMPLDQAMQLALDIAQGLAALHQLDIIHRDLKPGNILIDDQGHAKIAGLGLAQIPGGPSLRSRLSQAAPHPGTPGYMSPEQQRQTVILKPPSDIYSLGLVLFEMLSGRRFESVEPGTGLRDLCPDAPKELENLLAQMLAEDPSQRPWDGAEMAAALLKIQSPPPTFHWRRISVFGLVVLFLILAGGFLALRRSIPAPGTSSTALIAPAEDSRSPSSPVTESYPPPMLEEPGQSPTQAKMTGLTTRLPSATTAPETVSPASPTISPTFTELLATATENRSILTPTLTRSTLTLTPTRTPFLEPTDTPVAFWIKVVNETEEVIRVDAFGDNNSAHTGNISPGKSKTIWLRKSDNVEICVYNNCQFIKLLKNIVFRVTQKGNVIE